VEGEEAMSCEKAKSYHSREQFVSQATMNCVAKIDKQLRKVKGWGEVQD